MKTAAASPPSPRHRRSAPLSSSLAASASASVTGASITWRRAVSGAARAAENSATGAANAANNARTGPSSPSAAASARKPASPAAGRGPRRTERSTWRTSCLNRAGACPPAASGCFNAANNATGARSACTISATKRRKDPLSPRAKGSPAESSISISQRRSSDLTRRASPRSAVMTAARLPGVSKASRRQRAITRASPRASGQSMRVSPSSAAAPISGASAAKRRHRSVTAAGRKASCSSRIRARRAGVGAPPGSSSAPSTDHGRTAAGVTPKWSKSWAMPWCGWAGSALIAVQVASSTSAGRPGSTTAPSGSVNTAAIKPTVAGIDPVEPAIITGSAGGCRRQASAWRASTRLRQTAGSTLPVAAKIAGQWAVRISRKRSVTCQ